MNTLDTIFNRKSTRSFKAEQIPEESLEIILKAGSASPIAMARYDSVHITVVQNEEVIARIFKEAEEEALKSLGVRKNMNYGAKTIVVISSIPTHRIGMEYINSGIVVENMVLAATDLGIDSVILGSPIAALAKNCQLKEMIGIPDGFTPIIGAALGYATQDEQPKEHSITTNRI